MTAFWTAEEKGGIITARFSSAPMNYHTDKAIDQFAELVDAWGESEARAVVLVGGTPGKFITHFDPEEIVGGMRNQRQTAIRGPVRNVVVNRVLGSLTELRMPVIAALNGDAMGFGLELALACDMRVGERGDYRYGLPEVRLGILPGSGGTQRLSRLVGLGAALDIVLRARIMAPEEAYRMGVITHLADDAVEYSHEIARQIASLPALAVAVAKRALHQGFDAPLGSALAIESDASVRVKLGPDSDAALAEYVALPESERRLWLEGKKH